MIRNKDVLIYGIFFISLVLIILLFKTYHNQPLEEKILDVKFIVGDKPGFDLNDSGLIFGRIIPGSTASRKVRMFNGNDFLVEVRVFTDKSTANFLRVDAPFNLLPNESKDVIFSLTVPKNMSFGEYSGKTVIEIRKAD